MWGEGPRDDARSVHYQALISSQIETHLDWRTFIHEGALPPRALEELTWRSRHRLCKDQATSVTGRRAVEEIMKVVRYVYCLSQPSHSSLPSAAQHTPPRLFLAEGTRMHAIDMPPLAAALAVPLVTETIAIPIGAQLRELRPTVLVWHPLRRVAVSGDGDLEAIVHHAFAGVLGRDHNVIFLAELLDCGIDGGSLCAAFGGVPEVGPGEGWRRQRKG